MDFDQHVHAMRDGRILDVFRGGIVERRHDDQDAVGAVGARLDHLINVVHEILAQHRQRGGRTRRHHEIEMALKRRRVGQHPQTGRAAAALSNATSRKGLGIPSSTLCSAIALAWASPPFSASPPTHFRPASSGVTSNVRIVPFSSAATKVGPVRVISSRPSEPCTTQTDSAPRFFNTCASGCTHCRENTPTICRLTPAGLDSGPNRLKIVRVTSSTRVGPTFFVEGCWDGANMKPIPASLMQRPTCSGLMSILTPSEDNTSAAPERDDSARLPCLATGTPTPATMNEAQVETLTEPEPSPPVPTTSTASAGALTRSILARIADTAPGISSTVSPRTRSAISNPPICEGVASPDIMLSKADAASLPDKAPPLTLFPLQDFRPPIARYKHA